MRFHLLQKKKVKKKEGSCSRRLEKLLSGGVVREVEVLNEDRILRITFERERGRESLSLVVELFPRRPNLYVLNGDKRILFALHPVESDVYELPEKPLVVLSKTPEQVSSAEIERRYDRAEAEECKKEVVRFLQSRRKKWRGLADKMDAQRQNCAAWQEVHHEAELLQAHFHLLKRKLKEVVVSDWERDNAERVLALDPMLQPHENVEKRFRRARKMRRGLEHAQEQGRRARDECAKWEGLLGEVEEITDLDALRVWTQSHDVVIPSAKSVAKKEQAPRSPFREYRTASGLSIFVGKSAADNEKLTFSFARGSDWWFHVVGYPGSHVILRVRQKDEEPDQEAILDAMQVALHYSKAKQAGGAEVHITQRKYVTKADKRKKGQVFLAKHRTAYVKVDAQRFLALKSSK